MDLLTELTRTNADPAVIAQVRALLEEQQKAQQRLQAQVAEKEFKIKALTAELAYYRRIQYGKKSEAFKGEQRDLFDETVDTDLAAIHAELDQPPKAESKSDKPAPKHPGRQTLPPELPRVEHRHEPESCQCGACGKGLILIGEDISEQLDLEPGRFFVHRHIRPQYACRACETVTAAPVPPAIIDGGLAAPGLLAWVGVCKFTDHLPLYRVEQITARQGVPIARSTLAAWIGRIGVALQPLCDRLAELLRQRPCLHADETPVRQLDPGAGKTKTAYLWAYRSNDFDTGPPIVVFDYQTGRAGAHARAFLEDWRGHLMVDDFSGYKKLFTNGVTELACLVHIRRNFFKQHQDHGSPIAAEALRRIGLLYEIEREGRELTIPARLQLRQQRAMPVLADLYDWLQATQKVVAKGSKIEGAIAHAIKRWPALLRYADSGSLPIDNNPAENSVRPIVLGKKNWLFAGSERAGQRAAAIQSLLATAKLNGIEPLAWLTETLEKLPTCPNNQLDTLLPFVGNRRP